MRKINKKCIVCGTSYQYCPSCKEYSKEPTWKNIYHDENCKNIFEIASDYLAEVITKEEAKEKFDKCDLSNKANFHASIVKAIDEVYGAKTETKVVETQKEEVKKEVKLVSKKVEKVNAVVNDSAK